MSEEELYRIYEIYFRAMCNEKYTYRNNMNDVFNYLKALSVFMKFDNIAIADLAKVIFEKRFNVNDAEKVKLALHEGFNKTQACRMLHITPARLDRLAKEVIYPRTEPRTRPVLKHFMEQYLRFNTLNPIKILEWRI